jgi:hypothetical protein
MSGTAILGEALKTASKGRRVRKSDDGSGKRQRPATVHKASFATAQKKIKKGLAIKNTVDGDAYVALGRCLDEVADVVLDRWIKFAPADKATKTLDGALALSGLMSLLPIGTPEHAEVNAFVNDSLDAFHGVSTK